MIAVVGLGCRFPEANDPAELWDSVLTRRRSFRRMPAERLDLADYHDADPQAEDKTYSTRAALLEGWEFDRAAFRVPGSVFRATDPAHWLALETAARALEDAGFPQGSGLDRERVAVLVGNTLTGEMTRAATLRARWPYVRRVMDEALRLEGMDAAAREAVLERAAVAYRAPFEPVGDETLAGGLSNTIAGRICNHFDFGGGGYTVDGACASSLLAVAHACSMLVDGSCDFALAGGVDLSLDPFELVGFAKAGALASQVMRVYDERAEGFWPGEGCGVVALMRASDARTAGLEVYAEIAGWGVSSDGKGGMTRPERDGQILALRRACARAGIAPAAVGLYEGHGTGTAVGDATELAALLAVRSDAPKTAVLGSIKANIGHTKAAAGVAGLIKAVMSLSTGVLPPATGCERPHAALRDSALRVLDQPEGWPEGERVAGVSAMGFGGINTHLVLRNPGDGASGIPGASATGSAPLVSGCSGLSSVDASDLFVFSAPDAETLLRTLERVAAVAVRLSEGELHDLACDLAAAAPGPVRVAFAAATVEELEQRATRAASMLADLPAGRLVAKGGVFAGDRVAGRVTLLFPGQGAPVATTDTAEAQPAIYQASLDALGRLTELGLTADAAVGHSLGEIAGLVWAGCLDAGDGLELVRARGRVMADLGAPGTGMVSVAATRQEADRLCAGTGLVIAAFNGPSAHVLAGSAQDVELAAQRARAEGIPARILPVTRAFHSAAVAECAGALKDRLDAIAFRPPVRRLISTVAGRALTPLDAITDLLREQITAPVLFDAALREVLGETDLFCEVGPGGGLSSLVSEYGGAPAVSPAAGGEVHAVAALFAAGAVDGLDALFARRASRPFDLWRERTFLTNPCSVLARPVEQESHPGGLLSEGDSARPSGVPGDDVASVVVRLVAAATELDPASITPGLRLLSDLHLTSLRVARLVAEAARTCVRRPPMAPLTMADASIAEVVAVVEALPEGEAGEEYDDLSGVAPWVACFAETTRPAQPARPVAPTDRPTLSGTPVSPADGSVRLGCFVSPADVVVLPADADPALLLETARIALTRGRLVVATDGPGLSGFFRSLQHEHPSLDITIVRLPHADADDAARWAGPGWREVVVGADGEGREVVGEHVPLPRGALPVGPDDVVLVSGGGKGIGHTCAIALAKASGAALALIGRARPEDDEALAANLARCTGLRIAYESADVTDADAVAAAVRRLEARLGTITAVVHAGGVNEPARFADVTADDLRRHRAPKVDGLRNLLAAVPSPRLVVTFGSVIGRYGMVGECAYAHANGALRAQAETLAAERPECRVVHLDWSLWSGPGMGERLGVVDALLRAGVTAITPDEGAELFLRAISADGVPTALAVHGRVGAEVPWPVPPQLRGRFMETVRVHYPGVELVAEARLDLLTDPYLTDHRIDGVAVVPAVVSLEALAQAASALAGRPLRTAEAVAFDQPVIVPDEGARTVRICALRRDDAVEVVLRCDESGFRVDHVRARFPLHPELTIETPEPAAGARIDPDELYGPVYFHGRRFRRVTALAASARSCRAELGPADTVWFDAVLGGPAVNDATIHALQACVPHRRLLPVGCDRVSMASFGSDLDLRAVERHADRGRYVWDVAALDREGRVAVRWEGLRLQDVGPLPRTDPWPGALFSVYLERAALALGLDPALRVEIGETARRLPPAVPESGVSRSHVGGLALTVHGGHCDWEPVSAGAPDHALAALIAARCGEPPQTSATRVWTAVECLSKAGLPPTTPLVLSAVYDGGWVAMRSGDRLIASIVARVEGIDGETAVAIMTGDPA